MKPAVFGYARPESVSEALAVLEELNEECKVLAGGQSLVPLMNIRLAAPTWLVDVSGIEELSSWAVEDGRIRVGAVVTQAELEDAGGGGSPLLASALSHVGHRTIRNRGTVCGSIAHADPAAELPAVATALRAVIRIAGSGRVRDVAAGEFFLGPYTTVVAPDELVIEVVFPPWPHATGAFAEVARRHGDFALTGAAIALGWEDGRITDAGIALCGAGPVPVAVAEGEAALRGSCGDEEAIAEAAAAAERAARPSGDYHATAKYRQAMAAEMVRRALEAGVAARSEAP